MKILIISFDKKLGEELKNAFSKEEVIVVKNSEEALKIAPTHVDVVIYDAISGAISEEDINNIYQKKFSDSRYVILYDELFPVNRDNLLPEKKVLVQREESPQKIKEIALSSEEFIQEDTQPQPQVQPELQEQRTEEEKTQELPPLDESLLELSAMPQIQAEETEEAQPQEKPQEQESVEDALQKLEELAQELESPQGQEETAPEPAPQPVPEPPPVEEAPVVADSGKRKITLVSFDATLIDSIKTKLGSEYDIVAVKNVRQAMESGEDSALIIYDAISGVIAERGLTELSENPKFSVKPFLILVDDLFPIEVDNIPLSLKKSLSRDAGAEAIEEAVKELMSQAQVSVEAPSVETPAEPPSEPQAEPAAQAVEEQEVPALENLDKIVEELEKDIGEPPSIEVEEPAEEEIIEEEIEIPAIDELAKEVATEPSQTQKEAEKEVPSPPAGVSAEALPNVEEIIKRAVAEKLDGLNIKAEISQKVEEVVQKAVAEAVSKIDIAKIVREETSRILKQKLEELIK